MLTHSIEEECNARGNVSMLTIKVFVITIFLISVLIAACMILPLANAQRISSINPPTNPIKHIVVIMQENRSFDNYFGSYPGLTEYLEAHACHYLLIIPLLVV
jgi:phospholipase C